MAERQYRVVRRVAEAPNTFSIFLQCAENRQLDPFRSGQYLTFHIPGIGKRDYVLSSFSKEPRIYRISILHGGDKSIPTPHSPSFWLCDVAIGDVLTASGPSGSFHLQQFDRPIVILSKGIGEAAVTAMAEELAIRQPGHQIVFLHSTFNSSTFALKGKLKSLSADLPHATWRVWFSRPLPSDRLGKEYDAPGEICVGEYSAFFPKGEFDAYICGPEEFVTSTETALRDLKIGCRSLFRQSMGRDIEPPIEVAQEELLPPLKAQTVKFSQTKKEAVWTQERGTLLEFAESLGIQVPFSCRTGMCGTCAQKVISGQVARVRETSAKTKEPYQLLCSNIPMSDLEIDI